MARILLVEDEPHLAKLMADWLERDLHTVDRAEDGYQALSMLETNLNNYDVIVLDIMLPGKDGIDICQSYRRAQGTARILMATAKDTIDDKEKGFKAGADDYITKPFHLKELSARVCALLRRGLLITNEPLKFRDIVLDQFERKVVKGGKEVHLSPKEFHLLEFFMKNPSHVFSSRAILEHVWEPGSDSMDDTIRGHINRLRRKLDTPGKPSIISNVYGFGYKLEPDDQ